MKALLTLFLSSFLALATPDYQEATYESLLGSNDSGYAIKRVEKNNQGSHYSWQEKVYIDEYDSATSKRIKSTLLLDVVFHRDPSLDPAKKNNITKDVKVRDQSVQLAALLLKYHNTPDGFYSKWYEEKMGDLEIVHNTRVACNGHTLITARELKEKFGVSISFDKNTPPEWQPNMRLISFTAKSIFLIYTSQGEGEFETMTKVIHIGATRTRQMFDWLNMKPIYLKFSEHETLKEANEEALKLKEKLREKKIFASPQIWSIPFRHAAKPEFRYVIVDEFSENIIAKNRVDTFNKALDKPLVPISSKGFIEKWIPMKGLEE